MVIFIFQLGVIEKLILVTKFYLVQPTMLDIMRKAKAWITLQIN